MHTKLFVLLLFTVVYSRFSLAQETETIIRIHKIVGDTIDREEKLRLKVFPNIRNENYQFAVCILENDSMKLKVTYSDSSETKFPYSSALLLEDIDQIYLNQHAEYSEPSETSGKAILKITSNNSNKTLNLKKGKVVEINLKESNNTYRSKIQKVLIGNDMAILVKEGTGKTQLIALSEINYIYRYKRFENTTWKGLGALNFAIGATATLIDPSENYRLGSVFMAGGVIPWLFKNEKIRIDQASISVIYK